MPVYYKKLLSLLLLLERYFIPTHEKVLISNKSKKHFDFFFKPYKVFYNNSLSTSSLKQMKLIVSLKNCLIISMNIVLIIHCHIWLIYEINRTKRIQPNSNVLWKCYQKCTPLLFPICLCTISLIWLSLQITNFFYL